MGIKLIGSTGPKLALGNCRLTVSQYMIGLSGRERCVKLEGATHKTPSCVPGVEHRQAELYFRQLYETEQYSPPFVQCHPLLIDVALQNTILDDTPSPMERSRC